MEPAPGDPPFDPAEPDGRREPFPLFFIVAAFDAIYGVAAWLPGVGAVGAAPAHASEMLFGYVGAVLTGFLLTAARRWTGRDVGAKSGLALLALWIAARFAPSPPASLAVVGALPVVALAAVLSFHVTAAGDRRDAKVALLLWVFAFAALLHGLPTFSPWPDFDLRLALAAKIGVMAVIGGRVAPALTAHYLTQRGEAPPRPTGIALEIAAAIPTGAALAAWVLAPTATASGALLAAAAVAQALRLATWRGDRTIRAPTVLAFHVAYGFVVLGFALLAAAILAPGAVPVDAGVHAWTAGAIGGMSLAIMSSIIRRRQGAAFATTVLGVTSLICVNAAAASRLWAAFSPAPETWLGLAAACWSAAFAAFLAANLGPLVRWAFRAPSAAPRRRRR